MKVMTFNLRFDTEQDGDNAWPQRRELVAEVIERHAPDLLGTQEGLDRMLTWLAERLAPAYRLHRPAERVIDDTSQYPSLFYRSDAFELLAGGDRWLSDTPRVHLSKEPDSAFARMMSWARLGQADTGRELTAVVTHLDHVGRDARHAQAKRVAAFAEEAGEAVVVCGDFNARPGSRTHGILVRQSSLVDTWTSLGLADGEAHHTAHRFDGQPRKGRLDWILVGEDLRAVDARILDDHAGDRWPSDHFPVLAELEWVEFGADP